MVETEKVIGFYTDVFGVERDIHEEVERYTICYKGKLFDGDRDGWNSYNCDKWEFALGIYELLTAKGVECYITDNQYDVVFRDGEWD